MAKGFWGFWGFRRFLLPAGSAERRTQALAAYKAEERQRRQTEAALREVGLVRGSARAATRTPPPPSRRFNGTRRSGCPDSPEIQAVSPEPADSRESYLREILEPDFRLDAPGTSECFDPFIERPFV
jgi:hypothetical protein